MIKLTTLIQKIIYNAREHGFAKIILKLADGIWKEITQGGVHLFYITSDNLPNESFSGRCDLHVKAFKSKADIPVAYLDDLMQFVKKKYMKEETCRIYLQALLNPFQDGAEISVAIIDDKIVGYLWKMHAHDNYEPHFNLFPLLPRDGLLFGGYVLPEYRSLGIVTELIRHNSRLLREEGVERIFGMCKEWNQPSRRGILRSGLQLIGTARSIAIMGKRIIIWSNRKESTY